MHCVICGLDAGYNRAVVDLASGVEVGGLCVDCESAEFGTVLDRGHWTDDDCGLCPRDGQFALPRWEPSATERGGDVYGSVDYEVTGATPTVCDEHLHELRDRAARPDAAGPLGQHHRR